MNLPLYGKVKLYDTSKSELLELWTKVLTENNITIKEKTKAEEIVTYDNGFEVRTKEGELLLAKRVLIAIGRRGSPRKLNVPGESTEKVAYRLLEPENIKNKKIIVVGGGDSAVESAMLLAEQNKVVLSYRGEQFKRIKPKNREKIKMAIEAEILDVQFNTNLINIENDYVEVKNSQNEQVSKVDNDLVYIFAGGELPVKFLEKSGIKITKRFGYTMKKTQIASNPD